MELAALNIKLNPLKDGGATTGEPAYVLFSGDRSKAEIFLPDMSNGIVLDRSSEGNWTYKFYVLIAWKGYVIQKDGIPIFGGQ